jgi:hypothetical protein
MAASAEGAVPLSHPYHDISFIDPDTTFDEHRTWMVSNNNNLLSKWWVALDLSALGLSSAARPLYRHVKSLQFFDLDGVTRGKYSGPI